MGHHSRIKIKILAKMSTRSVVSTVANAIIQLTKILWAVFAHGYMEENNVKRTRGGTRLEFVVKKFEKFLIENLTGRKKFISNSDTL